MYPSLCQARATVIKVDKEPGKAPVGRFEEKQEAYADTVTWCLFTMSKDHSQAW